VEFESCHPADVNPTCSVRPGGGRVIDKAKANALKFVDHPKAKQADVKQSFNNSFVDEAMKQ